MGGFCGSNDPVAPSWVDQLGPRADGNMGPTGGPEARSKIFEALNANVYPEAQKAVGEATGATRDAVNSPLWGASNSYLSNVLAGGYLGRSPALDRAAAASRSALDASTRAADRSTRARLDATRMATMADVTGQQAANRSALARSGMRWSTAAQQSADATKAATSGRVAAGEQAALADVAGQSTAARAKLEAELAQQAAQAHQQERQQQTQAAAIAPTAAAGRASLAQSLPALQYAALSPSASLVQGLAGGTAMPQQFIRTPGAQDYLGQVAGIAGMAGY